MFSKDDIVDGIYPFEGIKTAFVLSFKFTNGYAVGIQDGHCLPFPSMYDLSPVQNFYERTIFSGIYAVRKSITHIMRWTGQENSHGFITGRDSFRFEEKGWLYFEHICKENGMHSQGPFKTPITHLQVPSTALKSVVLSTLLDLRPALNSLYSTIFLVCTVGTVACKRYRW